MTARPALAITVAVFLCCSMLVGWMGDFPVAVRTPAPQATRATTNAKATRAVLAVRDHVVPFQKWGTMMFTLPELNRHYDEVEYFTMASRDDGIDDILAALGQLLERHQSVDVLLLAHSNSLYSYLEALEPGVLQHLRLVYDTGCGDAHQAEQWRKLGADVHVGHPGAASISPLFYFYFLRRWTAGWTVEDATRDANARVAARLLVAQRLVTGVDLIGATHAVISGDTFLSLNDAPVIRREGIVP